tara:strand:+ start:384 stop:575 length:192 start_codon:yes stop_codon:yes gene_type:complete
MNLNNPATLLALHRINEIAKARRLALNTIDREARAASTVEALRIVIDRALAELATAEREVADR